MNRNMFIRVEENSFFGTTSAMASGTAAAAWDNSQGEPESKHAFSKCLSQEWAFPSKQEVHARVYVYDRERKRERERGGKRCRGASTELQWSGMQVTRQ